MIISVATCRELCPAEFAVVWFFSCVSAQVDLEVSLFEESQPTVFTLVVWYLIKMSVSLMKAKPRISRIGLRAAWMRASVSLDFTVSGGAIAFLILRELIRWGAVIINVLDILIRSLNFINVFEHIRKSAHCRWQRGPPDVASRIKIKLGGSCAAWCLIGGLVERCHYVLVLSTS